MSTSKLLAGVGVSPGLAVGCAVIARWELPTVPHRKVPAKQVKKEIRRLRAAVNDIHRELASLRERAARHAGPDEARIFDAQTLMLRDEEFLHDVEELISDNRLTAEKAYEFKALEARDLWSKAESTRVRERLADFSAVTVRVLTHLMRHPHEEFWAAVREGGPTVIVARELSPGLTVQLDFERVAGIATEEGTRTSHTAILAHSLGIPTVMGVTGALDRVRDGQTVVVDGSRGTLILDPTPDEINTARLSEKRRIQHTRELAKVLDLPSRTPDGTEVVIRGNVDLPEDIDHAVANRARGAGLVRTEFLVTSRPQLPSEDDQFEYFTRLAQAWPNDPVVIRTYDLGGDKFPPAFHARPERNPFLGWRAIRVCLDHPEIFRPQIRAILRAAVHGDLHIMIPLVTRIDEVERTREMMAAEAEGLRRDGIPAAGSVPVGVMVETPAAAIMADRIAEVSDFLSVGTNDLTQYTLVVDRSNAHLAPRFLAHDPGILRLMKLVVDAGRDAGVPVSVCGEMVSEPIGALLLMGLGYTTLSVAAPALALVRWLVRGVPLDAATAVADAALQARSADDVLGCAREELDRHVDLSVIDVPG